MAASILDSLHLTVPNFSCKLLNYLYLFQQNSVLCDVNIHCCDGTVMAHKVILAMWGLQHQVEENQNLTATEYTTTEIQILLSFLYTGEALHSYQEILKFQDIGTKLGIQLTTLHHVKENHHVQLSYSEKKTSLSHGEFTLQDYIENGYSQKCGQIDIIIKFDFNDAKCTKGNADGQGCIMPHSKANHNCSDEICIQNMTSSHQKDEQREVIDVGDTNFEFESHKSSNSYSTNVYSDTGKLNSVIPVLKDTNAYLHRTDESSTSSLITLPTKESDNLQSTVGGKESGNVQSNVANTKCENLALSHNFLLNHNDKDVAKHENSNLSGSEELSARQNCVISPEVELHVSDHSLDLEPDMSTLDTEDFCQTKRKQVDDNDNLNENLKRLKKFVCVLTASSHLDEKECGDDSSACINDDDKDVDDTKTKKGKKGKYPSSRYCQFCTDGEKVFTYQLNEEGKKKFLRHKFYNHPHAILVGAILKCDVCGCTYAHNIEVARYWWHRYKQHGMSYDESKFPRIYCKEQGCNYWTIARHSMTGHVKSCHQSPHLLCEVCNKAFKTERQLTMHMETHSNNRQKFPCEICGKMFSQSSSVKGHVNRVHNNNKIITNCDQCSRSFGDIKQYYDHMVRVHREQLPNDRKYMMYSCDSCDFVTLMKSRILCHEKLHKKQKGIVSEQSFECDICGKKFDKKSDVKSHKANVHVSEVSCPYPGCERVCKPAGMKKHVAMFHEQKRRKDFTCHYCDYKSVLESNVRKHLRGVHKEEVPTIEMLKKQVMSRGTGFYQIELKQNENRCQLKNKSKNQ